MKTRDLHVNLFEASISVLKTKYCEIIASSNSSLLQGKGEARELSRYSGGSQAGRLGFHSLQG
jgi:hypothetical protein